MRVLSLGWDLEGPGIIRAEFPSADSLASFDVVLVDPAPLADLWRPYAELAPDGTHRLHPARDFGLSRALGNLFSLRQREAEDLLGKAGGILVVKVRPPGEGVVVEGNPPRRLDIYGFLPKASLVAGPHHLALPQGLRFMARRGHDLRVVEELHPLAAYLAYGSRLGYEAVLTTALGAPLSAFGRVLAQNRVGDPLALDLPVGLGRLLFLPSFPGAEGREAWEFLRTGLAALLSRPLPEAAPGWLANYPLPGEEEVRKRAEEIARERERLSRCEEELGAVQERFALGKALLYPRGRAGLAQAARAAFAALGFTVGEGEDPEGFLVQSPEENFLVRVALAPFSPVGPEEGRALLVALDRLRNEERKEVRGLLLCLAQPELDPKRRGPAWHEALERASRDHRLVLVSSYDLFRALAQVLGGADPEGIRKSLAGTEGSWRPDF